ncbi:cation diffusion facilitator family transporter [Solibacillus sp. FSL R7-0682]|uniref:cation diffusion facilitator family transporter n=1 Tax=Solibacillus sp. FSL R7-0682 TaxID=2921690 RepID=UPI0030FBA289
MAEHHHHHTNNKKVLAISFIIITTFMIVEAIGGLLTNSLALLSDAGHMLSDAISLCIALIAFMLSERAVTKQKTFGYKRFEVLAAAFNGLTLIIIAVVICYEAIGRFMEPLEVATLGMLVISVTGLIVNIIVAWIMMRGADTKENLNMRSAFMHVIGDMLGSIGAIIAALLIMGFGFLWADPLASMIVALLVLRSGYSITKASIHILMEGAPVNIQVDEIVKAMTKNPQVLSLHDLHIWTITSGLNALTCHLVVNEKMTVVESEGLLKKIEHELLHHGIHHVTIQLETVKHSHEDSLLCKVEGHDQHDHHH